MYLQYIVEEDQLQSQSLCISVWKQNTLRENLFIGQVTLPLVSIDLNDPSHYWYTLTEVIFFNLYQYV